MDKRYIPDKVEEKIYSLWEKSGFFNPDNLPKTKKLTKLKAKSFCIIMPPPNANGSLHIGHALFVTLEDIMIRFARMKGQKTLWLPGADHAGFETQVVFDKKLEKEGRSRFKMDRKKLWQEMYEFTQENKKTMENQLRKLGASCDWSREKFTLDPDIIKEVQHTFIKMHKEGLIYRGLRTVNWCVKHQTALSGLEVKRKEEKGKLYYMKYGPFTLATARPETKFGDTAIAVHPNDKRYKKYIGKEVEVQGLLGKFKIKVIADKAVDPEFGTGVIKVTPAHDPLDAEIGTRHNLEVKQVIDRYGKLNEHAGRYAGMKVMEAREKVVEDLKKKGLLVKVDENYTHNLAVCFKCERTLEPIPLPQWYVKTKPLAKPAIETIEKGKIKIIPTHRKKVILHWLKNIEDWNISRQIIWGIRIPAWICEKTNEAKSYKLTMGFHESVVPQIFKGKIATWRIRDHGFKKGDAVAFENSQEEKIFGHGTITKVEKLTVGTMNLKDKTHYATYKTRDELLRAFKKHNPDKNITLQTPVFAYHYTFKKANKLMKLKAISSSCPPIVSIEKPKQCPSCKSEKLSQDPDVFDTWFSSGQWPYLTLGFKNSGKHDKDFKDFYPTSVMETASDILFFWVARMIMMGIYRTKKLPFKNVYLHGLILDKDKQKMSKSKGNVIDPLGVAEEYGTDAVRMALIAGNTPGRNSTISEDKIRGYRNFATKIWNITRFISMNYEEIKTKPVITPKDKKNLKQLEATKKKVTKHLEKFEFHRAAEITYHYIWHTFADKIIEETKPRLQNGDKKDKAAALETLITILTESIKMLHPFMPYATEEIFQHLQDLQGKKKKTLLIVEPW
tara:strand:- start:1406 stop:3931 length:2526 start_codon:yes stop_codon:yes gene_type:complete